MNNAGIVSGKSLLEISDEEIVRTFEVNSLALFWTSRVFLPEMLKRRKGHIVTIASSAGLVGVSKLTDYCSSKWAAVGFDESLRMELRQTCPEVKTTVVCPFFIDTGMFDGVKSRFEMLLPILKEESMAKDIVEGVEAGKTRIVSPDLVKIVPIMRALPTSVFDWVADFLGINVSMEEFVKQGSQVMDSLGSLELKVRGYEIDRWKRVPLSNLLRFTEHARWEFAVRDNSRIKRLFSDQGFLVVRSQYGSL